MWLWCNNKFGLCIVRIPLVCFVPILAINFFLYTNRTQLAVSQCFHPVENYEYDSCHILWGWMNILSSTPTKAFQSWGRQWRRADLVVFYMYIETSHSNRFRRGCWSVFKAAPIQESYTIHILTFIDYWVSSTSYYWACMCILFQAWIQYQNVSHRLCHTYLSDRVQLPVVLKKNNNITSN